MGDDFLERIVAWAKRSPDIRALVLTGSRARPDEAVDEVSDYDVEVFTTTPSRYAAGSEWMGEIAEVWVYLPTTRDDDDRYVMRLVVFEGAAKVDFGFAPVDVLMEMASARKVNDLYERGYRVLLDRDGVAAGLPPPSYGPPQRTPPSEREFRAAVEEFWFEVSHIPKLLARNELWVVKMRDWTMKELLLQMIEWHALATKGSQHDVWHIGTRMAEWADEGTWQRLHDVFGRFEAADAWRALEATIALYRDLGEATARAWGYRYPSDVDHAITAYAAGYDARYGRR